MGRFVANPEVLILEGNKIDGYSGEFKSDVDKVYETLENMVQREYISPEAMAIKEEIDKYREDLENMAKVIKQYGGFCVRAGNKVIDNQNGIIDEING